MAVEDQDTPRWRPLSVRQGGTETAAEYDVLHEGVPVWLSTSLIQWVRTVVTTAGGYIDEERLLQLERERRVRLVGRSRWTCLVDYMREDEDFCLDVVDLLLRDLSWQADRQKVVQLAKIMLESGSAYQVSARGEGVFGFELQRRVSETVAASAEKAFQAGRPGDHLRMAWRATYGRSPNANEAYDQAVRAVEAAAQPIVSPSNPKATLGTIITALRDKPAKWQVVLDTPGGFDEVGVVQVMAELLWKGHTTRHGTADPAAPIVHTQEQAEAAVHLAVLLVQWFTSGTIRPVP